MTDLARELDTSLGALRVVTDAYHRASGHPGGVPGCVDWRCKRAFTATGDVMKLVARLERFGKEHTGPREFRAGNCPVCGQLAWEDVGSAA